MAAFLLIATVILFRKEKSKLFATGAAILIAIGLSCWFWLAALGLKEHVRIDTMLQGKFDFHNNFSTVGGMFGYDSIYAIGWLPPAVIIVCAVAILRGNRNPLLAVLLGTGLLLVFLQSAASTIVWETIPFLHLFQFPWRFMGPLSVTASLMVGLLYSRYLSHVRAAEVVIVLLIAVNAIPLLQRYQPLSADDNKHVATYFNPRGVRQRNLPATVLDEYLPKAANKELSTTAPMGAVVIPMADTTGKARLVQATQTRIHLEVTAASQTTVHLARWYFPGWHATLNGVDHPLSADSSGAIQVNIPTGQHQLIVQLSQPALRQWGMVISGVSIVFLIVLLPTTRRLSKTWSLPGSNREGL